MPKIEIEEIENEIFKAEYGIPTLLLGSGSWRIASVTFEEENMGGVAFSLTNEGEIGREFPGDCGERVDDWEVTFQILSTSKDSLMILKEKVDEAIERWRK